MSKFFINHPIPALVLSIILTLVGVLTVLRLPIAEYPDIAPPTVFVSTSYIGADASVVNNTVAQIIEEAVNGAGDIEFMSSTVDTTGKIAFHNGKEAATFSVMLTNDANTLETVSAVKEILAEAEEDFPPDMEFSISLDATRFIQESLEEVSKTFFEVLLLVVIIVWIFLKNFRATIIALLAIPVSIVATFAVFPFVNFTINTLTLFALILAIGLVVDDAIVVIEIVEQNLERGMEIKSAMLAAMQEIQTPIIAIACVLAAVFIPAAFLEGITGELYRQFALTIAISMFFSTFAALSLTPALCVLILKRREKISSTSFDKFKSGFESLLEVFMRRKFLSLLILILVTAGAVVLNDILPSEYKPYVDIRVDKDKAKFWGVNLDDIYSALSVNFGGDEVNDFTSFGRVYKVVMQAETGYRNSIDTARFIFVRNENGELIPLDTLVTLTRAAIEATTERLRPILMTSLAFVVACIPLAMAEGAGSAARNGMGAAVVSGMLFATVLGVFIVPILFSLIVRRKKCLT